MKTLIVIPARLASTRLPKKLLLNETGKPLIQHTYEAAQQSKLADDLLVAADDPEIVQTVQGFGGKVELTDREHASGTDRLAEIALRHPDVDIFVNVQGDEPEIDWQDIDLAIQLLTQHAADSHMSTLAVPISDVQRITDPACVKVVFDQQGRAMYFSRSPIPFPRDGFDSSMAATQGYLYFQHVGLYVYRRNTLLELTRTPRSGCEVAESLEQLRALDLGKTIRVGITENSSRGIDTSEDYQAFVSRQANC